MTLLHRLPSVLRWLFRRSQAEQDLHDELDAFVEMAADDHLRDGVALVASSLPAYWASHIDPIAALHQ